MAQSANLINYRFSNHSLGDDAMSSVVKNLSICEEFAMKYNIILYG